MNQHDIGKALRALPRHNASKDFTRNVLARLPETTPLAQRPPRPLLMGLAGALATVLIVVSGWYLMERRETERANRRVEDLRQEYLAIQQELQELRSLTAASGPVLELGGTEELDFFIDLRELAGSRATSAAQPVGYRR